MPAPRRKPRPGGKSGRKGKARDMATMIGKKARKQAFGGKGGGDRAILRPKHGGAYVDRPGVYGDRTRAQKRAARATSKKARA